MSSGRKACGLAVRLAPLVLLALGGCGFTPLYGGDEAAAPVSARLEEVKIGNIPERAGQLLRLSLQDRMEADGAPTEQKYLLTVDYSIAQEGIGIQEDTSTTRNRFIADANWRLAPVGAPGQALVSGQANTEDALNVIDQQYFAVTLETSKVDQQLADEIAGQITQQIAVYFKTHPGA